MKVQIVNKSTNPLPAYQTNGAVGLDLRANESLLIEAGERALISTGLYISIPEGYEGQVRPRSGLAISEGLTVLNAPGTIDSDYRGEIKVILLNTDKQNFFVIETGDRIAQLIISPIQKVELEEVQELDKTDRGESGFGSTGITDEVEPDNIELLDLYDDTIPFNYVEEQENI
jgi:dUTP pyrophosphatase